MNRKWFNRWVILFVVVYLAFGLAACVRLQNISILLKGTFTPTPTPTPTPTSTPVPSATPVPTATRTDTPTPTSTSWAYQSTYGTPNLLVTLWVTPPVISTHMWPLYTYVVPDFPSYNTPYPIPVITMPAPIVFPTLPHIDPPKPFPITLPTPVPLPSWLK